MGQSPCARGAAAGETGLCAECVCACAGTSLMKVRPD